MNVILNVDEVHAVLTRISSMILDQAGLAATGERAIREWRDDHLPGANPMDELAIRVNEKLGNEIDTRTTRRIRVRGKRAVSAGTRWQG